MQGKSLVSSNRDFLQQEQHSSQSQTALPTALYSPSHIPLFSIFWLYLIIALCLLKKTKKSYIKDGDH